MEIDLSVAQIDPTHQRFIDEAILAFNSAQTFYRLNIRPNTDPIASTGLIDWGRDRANFRPPDGGNPRLLITDRPFVDNWFSHCDGRGAVVSTHQWFQLFAPPCLQSYLLLEFGIAVACFTCGLGELHLKPHDRSIGCLGDMCGFKPDILLKLRAGYICAEHCQMFREYGASESQVLAMIRTTELARAYALARDDEKRRLGAIRSGKVFVVHGRHDAARGQLVDVLNTLHLEPIVIMNEPIQGRTVIEQIEEHSDVGFAFVLFTPDDRGCLAGSKEIRSRPRQNVVFEYGLFVGWLGRHRVCCVAPSSSIELPSDLAGVLQLRYQTAITEIQARIRQELLGAGYTG